MSRVVADVTGDREVIRELTALLKNGVEIGMQVLGEAAERIAAKARTLCPVDDYDGGDLLDTIRTTKPQRTAAGRISAGIVAGGESLKTLVSEQSHKDPGAYAVVVHEDMSMRHPNG